MHSPPIIASKLSFDARTTGLSTPGKQPTENRPYAKLNGVTGRSCRKVILIAAYVSRSALLTLLAINFIINLIIIIIIVVMNILRGPRRHLSRGAARNIDCIVMVSVRLSMNIVSVPSDAAAVRVGGVIQRPGILVRGGTALLAQKFERRPKETPLLQGWAVRRASEGSLILIQALSRKFFVRLDN